jgi:hypothetical protein
MGGREEECGEAREDEEGLDLAGDQEDSTPIVGDIKNHAEKVALEKENETPRSKKPSQKSVELAPNHPSPKCPLYTW